MPHAPSSMLPRTTTTGASFRSASRIAGLPTSPAWMMSSEPRIASTASSRSNPCVSEISPTILVFSRGLWRESSRGSPVGSARAVILRLVLGEDLSCGFGPLCASGNSEPRQVLPQLLDVLELNWVHPHFLRALEIQPAIVNHRALVRRRLRDFQRQAVDSTIRFAHAQIARTEKHFKIIAQLEGTDAVVVDLERLVVERRRKIAPRRGQLPQRNRAIPGTPATART